MKYFQPVEIDAVVTTIANGGFAANLIEPLRRLSERDARRQASVHVQEHILPGSARQLLRFEASRNPHLRHFIREAEGSRHDTHNGIRFAVQLNTLAHDLAILSKSSAPVCIAQ
jgi:hypothetical protein